MPSGKDIVKLIKAPKAPKGKNVTFHLSTEVATRFAKACQDQDVKQSRVIEELMKGFLATLK